MKKQSFKEKSTKSLCRLRAISFLIGVMGICFSSVFAQNTTLTGKVTNEQNEPLIGVAVQVVNSSGGSITDIDGNYSILAAPNATLRFSYIGMKTLLVKVDGRKVINVSMAEDVTMLTETVVIGYGSAKKRDLTGSITNIKGEEIANKPASNPLSSLQGKVAGVQVVNTGRAGADPEIRVRGTNSINGFAPLYIVDGLFNDNINFLNPADIESMEILKDPSSLAIFGVRGANGVIIVTTKKAKAGQDAALLQIVLGVLKQVPANRHYSDNGKDLKHPGAHLWISQPR